MTGLLYDIESAWLGGSSDPAEIGKKFLQTLGAFERIDPTFRAWGTTDSSADDGRGLSLDAVRSDFTSFVEANVYRDDWDQPAADHGYWLWAGSDYYPYAPPSPTAARFELEAGSKWANKNLFEIGSNFAPPDLEIITYPIYRSALLAMISIWPAPWANARCAIWGEDPPTLPGEPPFPYSGYQMPWISYLCAERAANVQQPPEVPSERTPDGGLLMIAAETRFDPTNIEHMRRSRLMAQIMIEHGGDPDW